MRKRSLVLGLGLALTMGAASYAAQSYTDVPRGHWAYDAINRAVDAGVLEGIDGRFHGDKLITRHQMAVIVAKLLDRVGRGGTAMASKMAPKDVANLEALVIEFADELALMNVKLSTLEDAFVELRNTVEALKSGAHVEHHDSGPAAPQFNGLVQLGVVSTDDQSGGTPSRTRYAGTPDRFFFTVPQASLSTHLDLGHGVGAFAQFDYATDAPSSTTVGGGVQLNQAFLTWDHGPGHLGFKGGLMALPFQSWEYNGPSRTLNDTITPSNLNWLWETHRVVGFELGKSLNMSPDSVRWRAGVFTGNDRVGALGAGPLGGGRVYGNGLAASLDGPVSGTGTNTLDDTPGFYLDIESGTTGSFGWRLGLFDVGGDNTANAPALSTNDWSGYQVGAWLRGDHFKLQTQALFGTEDYGGGANNTDDLFSAYLLARYDLDQDTSVAVRYETWDVDNNGANTNVGTGDLGGNVVTFGVNRMMTDNSMFQFEYLDPTEDTAAGVNDADDSQVQARYKVWW